MDVELSHRGAFEPDLLPSTEVERDRRAEVGPVEPRFISELAPETAPFQKGRVVEADARTQVDRRQSKVSLESRPVHVQQLVEREVLEEGLVLEGALRQERFAG